MLFNNGFNHVDDASAGDAANVAMGVHTYSSRYPHTMDPSAPVYDDRGGFAGEAAVEAV